VSDGIALTVFWLSAAWLAYIYAGYAACIWLLSAVRPFRRRAAAPGYSPSISVLIAARNEEKDIGWKVEETLAWHYPADRLEVLVASDASDDGTDQILKKIQNPRVTFVRMEQRGGKNVALQHLAKLAKGELLFFTDANSHISSECVRRIAEHFADPSVGCVTGVESSAKEYVDGAIPAGGAAYFSYEAWLNALESRIGSVLVCDGSIFCTRRELFETLDPQLANDLEQPIKIAARGCKILYEPQARSNERGTSSPAQEFKRRRRICSQGFLALWRLRRELRGLRLWQFISRKFLRWITILPLLGLLTGSIALADNRMFLLAVALQLFFYLLAGAGAFVALAGSSVGLLSIPFYYVLVNLAAFAGILDTIFGVRYGVWDVATLSRGEGAQARTEASHA